MTTEFSDLSALLTQILSPALPYLLGMAKQATDEIGRQAGGTMLARAEKVWARLRSPVEQKEAAWEAAGDVATHPERSEYQIALKLQLEKLLAAQPSLAEDLQRLLLEMGIARGTHVNTIITGNARLRIGGDWVGGDKRIAAHLDPED